MSEMRQKKIVRTSKVTVERNKPKCSIHDQAMSFDVAGGYWQCPDADCNIRQYPQIELVQGGPAVVGTGALEVLIYEDPDSHNGFSVALRARENNVVMDITEHVQKLFKPAKDGGITLMLKVSRVVDTDGFSEVNREFD